MIQKKHILLSLLFLMSISISAQDNLEDKGLFLRIYDMQGVKISKGKLVSIDENTILLKRNKKSFSIEVTEIGTIKTRRALGHSIGMGALAGGTVGLIIGAAAADENDVLDFAISDKDFVLIYGAIGLLGGALTGGLKGLLRKKSRSFEVNKDPDQLRKFRELVSN